MPESELSLQIDRGRRHSRTMHVVSLYARNLPVNEICDRYSMCKSQVLRIARSYGLPRRPRHFPEKIRKATILLYKANVPIAEIQARLGVSQAYVSKTATEEGINRRKFKKRKLR